MRCELGCLSGISPVLLIALIGRILLDVALAILLTEVARAIHVSVSRRVVGNVRSALRTFRAAVFRRNGRRLCGHEDTPSWTIWAVSGSMHRAGSRFPAVTGCGR